MERRIGRMLAKMFIISFPMVLLAFVSLGIIALVFWLVLRVLKRGRS